MGVVYRARDLERNADVALKTLAALGADAVLRFKNEFRALCDLEHPNLCSLGELMYDAGRWFFTMELVDGIDFLQWVRPDPDGERSQPRTISNTGVSHRGLANATTARMPAARKT